MTASSTIIIGSSTPEPHHLCLRLGGDLSYTTADELPAAVAAHLRARPDTRQVDLQCGDVEFCDSHGISVLLTVARLTASAGAELRIVEPTRRLTRVLTITGVGTVLGVAASASARESRREP